MADEKKKKGLFGKFFGRKSKDDKLAEEAAERAAKQKLVDEQMAARMAAINAAALKSAREQDMAEAGLDPEEEARLEAEEKRKAEEQAKEDVERAKQLAEEKRQKEEEHRLEQERLAAEREAKAKAETERLEALKKEQEEKERLEREAREAAQKAEAEAKRKEDERLRIEREEVARKAKAEEKRRKTEDKALRDAERKKSEAEAEALRQKQDAERKAREEAEEKARLDREAQRKAEEQAEQHRLADLKAKQEQAERDRIQTERAAKKAAETVAELTPQKEKGFLDRITGGLRKSTTRMSDNMSAMFNKRKLDDEAIEDLEDLLVTSDFGIGPAMKVTERLSKDKFDKQVTDLEIKIALADVISDILTPLEKPLVLGDTSPQILMFVGVNGSGKTTTLGKIAKRLADQGKKVLIVAGDTFRAAADAQLKIWGERAGAPVMSTKQGADAAGLVYDAIQKAKDENYDVLMIDTAGRLQNRTELMDELSKIVRVIKKQDATAPHHSILVLDATVGQNALSQTEAFKQTAGVTGLIMTKLDGTAKGGVLVALSDKHKLPIHYIGIGERIEDLENFSAPVFAAALSGVADEMI